MRAAIRTASGLAVLLSVAVGVSTAQHPQTREGFWIGFGFGYGSAHLACGGTCSFNDKAKGGGATGFIKLGGTLSPQLLLGGEVNAWVKSLSDSGASATEAVGNVSFAVYYYPAPASGFFLKAGVGLANYRLSDGGSVTGNGFGVLAGLGYDIRVGRNISITPVGNFYFGSDGEVDIIPSVKHTVFDFGLGITFH